MFIRKYKYNMSELDCMEKYWGCCDSSISTSKFYEFSAKTEEHFEEIEQEIADIEASGLTYEEGDYIQIDGNVISVSGINPSDYALKSDLDELSGKVETLSSTTNTISGDVVTISGIIDSISAVTEEELYERLAEKQDKLTATNFIDLTNNVISAKISVLTQAQWAALTTKDPTVLYLIRES